jgi:hypothetical protein
MASEEATPDIEVPEIDEEAMLADFDATLKKKKKKKKKVTLNAPRPSLKGLFYRGYRRPKLFYP